MKCLKKIKEIITYTDSEVVLAWVINKKGLNNKFVSRRVVQLNGPNWLNNNPLPFTLFQEENIDEETETTTFATQNEEIKDGIMSLIDRCITGAEITSAKTKNLIVQQKVLFKNELKLLVNNKQLSPKHCMSVLSPFHDKK